MYPIWAANSMGFWFNYWSRNNYLLANAVLLKAEISIKIDLVRRNRRFLQEIAFEINASTVIHAATGYMYMCHNTHFCCCISKKILYDITHIWMSYAARIPCNV